MTIGEIVEAMIYIRDRSVVLRSDKDALADACNILDELPSDWYGYLGRTQDINTLGLPAYRRRLGV